MRDWRRNYWENNIPVEMWKRKGSGRGWHPGRRKREKVQARLKYWVWLECRELWRRWSTILGWGHFLRSLEVFSLLEKPLEDSEQKRNLIWLIFNDTIPAAMCTAGCSGPRWRQRPQLWGYYKDAGKTLVVWSEKVAVQVAKTPSNLRHAVMVQPSVLPVNWMLSVLG